MNLFGFSAETFGMVLKILFPCPEKNCIRNSFLVFLFRIFSDFELKIFETFGQKTSRSCQNYLLRVQRNNFWLYFFFKFWVVLDLLQKPLALFSNFYLRVQSKNSGRKNFFNLLYRLFFGFWVELFSEFWPKNFKKSSKLPSACADENFLAWRNFKSFESFWIFCRNLRHGSQNSISLSREKLH